MDAVLSRFDTAVVVRNTYPLFLPDIVYVWITIPTMTGDLMKGQTVSREEAMVKAGCHEMKRLPFSETDHFHHECFLNIINKEFPFWNVINFFNYECAVFA